MVVVMRGLEENDRNYKFAINSIKTLLPYSQIPITTYFIHEHYLLKFQYRLHILTTQH